MRSVFLVGFMGCGKSTVGERVAEGLNVPFVDLDREIESLEGATIPDIFEQRGEEAFREAETRALRIQVDRPPAVVATGGGLFVERGNRQLISRSGGCSVFLKTPWKVLQKRLGENDRTRPLWIDPESARRLYIKRLPAYQLAEIIIPLQGHETRNAVADTVLRKVVEVACGT